ncbi:hypothetical protein VPH35_131809 [Triticum aestivum]
MFQTNTRRRRGQPSGDPCPVLPDDLIEGIFARLPAKAVHRCRCLSRVWAATLASNSFADLHLGLANRHGGPRILFLHDSGSLARRLKLQVWSPDNPDCTTLMEGHVKDKLILRLVTQQCRGLVVLKTASTHYMLNPSTGRMAALPENQAKGGLGITRLGLGYHTRTRTHKVVRVYYLPISAGCEVYEINSSPALWRPGKGCAQKKPLGWVNKEHDVSVFTQGHIYWLAERKLVTSSKKVFVFSFNIDNETFGTVSLPPLCTERNCQDQYDLTEFGGRLCLFHTEVVCNVPHRGHNVWLLRDHDTGVWDLHCQIDLSMLSPNNANFMRYGYWIDLLSVVDNGRRIIIRSCREYFQKSSFELCGDAPVIGDTKNLLNGSGLISANSRTTPQAVLYEESIVSPGQPLTTYNCRDCLLALLKARR